MRYGYARVSSYGQAAEGTSIDTQTDILKSKGCEVVVQEVFTGKSSHRPKLDELLDSLKDGDELYVTKMDRLARSLSDGFNILEKLDERGVAVTVLNMGKLSGDPTSKLLRNMLLAIAEFERDMIAERTREGKERAKANDPNWRQGHPLQPYDKELFLELYEKRARGEISVKEGCEQLGVTEAKWYRTARRLKKLGEL